MSNSERATEPLSKADLDAAFQKSYVPSVQGQLNDLSDQTAALNRAFTPAAHDAVMPSSPALQPGEGAGDGQPITQSPSSAGTGRPVFARGDTAGTRGVQGA